LTNGPRFAGPMMGHRKSLDTDKASREPCEKLEHLRAADALARHHRAGVIDAMNLEYLLRYIETNRDSLPMDGSPQSGSFQRSHPMALRCRRVGAVPRHQKRTRLAQQRELLLSCCPLLSSQLIALGR
jgi:hypothetical protein